jgi:hypothetical protein
LEVKREHMEKATEAFREVAETLDRQCGRLEEWQEESRGLRGRMEEEAAGKTSEKQAREEGEKGELEGLMEAAQKGDPKIMQNILELLRKAVAGVKQEPEGVGRRPGRAKGEDGTGAGPKSEVPRRSRSPLRGRAWSK